MPLAAPAPFLATTVSAPVDATLRSLAGLAQAHRAAAESKASAKPIGIHLEGPFLSHAQARSASSGRACSLPISALFDRMFEAAEGQVRLMTLAPELPGAAELAAHAASRGVRVSVGHSDATAERDAAAPSPPAPPAPRIPSTPCAPSIIANPGILGTVLTTDALYAELICDGIHTTPEMVRLWWRAKGPERAILITDAMSAAGMPDGEYQLGGFAVQVAEWPGHGQRRPRRQRPHAGPGAGEFPRNHRRVPRAGTYGC